MDDHQTVDTMTTTMTMAMTMTMGMAMVRTMAMVMTMTMTMATIGLYVECWVRAHRVALGRAPRLGGS